MGPGLPRRHLDLRRLYGYSYGAVTPGAIRRLPVTFFLILGRGERQDMRALAMILVMSMLAGLLVDECATRAAEPVRLIFDTDIGNDVDDVLALGVIHALQSRGQCELLAVTITKDHAWAAELVDAINTFYGRGDIPIGMARSGITPDEGKFLQLARVEDNHALRFPHDLDGAQTPSGTDVLRQVLSQQPDQSVSIAQVGFSTNLARLLASPPDSICPLSGKELVQRKVRLLSIMAGHFRPEATTERFLEYNVKTDIQSCQELVKSWPTPVVFSGFEIGIAVPYPAESIERDYGYVEHHPLAELVEEPDRRAQRPGAQTGVGVVGEPVPEHRPQAGGEDQGADQSQQAVPAVTLHLEHVPVHVLTNGAPQPRPLASARCRHESLLVSSLRRPRPPRPKFCVQYLREYAV